MKKKVVIERVPSSKKKVVIEGLPKADIGKRMAKNQTGTSGVSEYGNSKRRMQSASDKDIAQYPNPIAYPVEQILGTNQYGADDAFYQEQSNLDDTPYKQKTDLDDAFYKGQSNVNSIPYTQQIGLDDTYYSGADPYVENPKYSDSKSVKNKKGLKNKKRANWDFSNFNVYLSGLNPKYNYLTNKLIGEIGNAKSIFKTGAPMKNQNYLGYNPYYSPFMYAEGGYLPKYVEAGITGFMNDYPRSNDEDNLDKEPEGLTDISPAYDPFKNMSFEQTMGTLGAELPKEPNNPMLEKSLKKYQKNQKALKTIQKMGAIGAPLSTLGTIGMEATGDALSLIVDKRQSDEFNKMNAQIRAQAPMANVQPTTLPTSFQGDNPLATGAYGGRIKRYAADGMQIKQIGGMGEPNVEVEGEEHIQLPNGFSQEIKGKKHSEGGIPINLPSGTKIFSEKLKVPVKFIQELISVNPEYAFLKNISLPKSGNISYADLAKKFETKKYVDMLNSKDADPIQITTAQLMIQQNNAFLEKLFTLQEQNKLSGVHGPQVQQNAQQEQQEQEAQQAQMQGEQMEQPMMKYGGYYLPKAVDGNVIKKLHDTIGITPDTPGYGTDIGKRTAIAYNNWAKNNLPEDYNETDPSDQFWNYLSPRERAEMFISAYDHDWMKPLREKLELTAQPAAQPLALQPITTAENPRVKANYPAISYDQTTETGFKYGQPNQYDWLNWQRAIDESAANRWLEIDPTTGEPTGKRTGFKVPVPGMGDDLVFQQDPQTGKLISPTGVSQLDIAEKYYGTRDPQSLVNMAYQEQSYDDALDTPQGRKALAEMWEEVGNTNLGKKLGIKVDVKGLSKLNDKDLINVLNKLRPAYIDSQLDYRKAGYITPKAIEIKKKKEEQEADAMRGKTSFVPSEGSAATKGIPFNLGIGLPIPQIDSVYAGDYYKLQPQLEFLKRVTPDYNPATRAMRAMVTNDTDLSGVGMANRQNAYANFLNQMGDIQNQANLQNIGIEQQEKFGNRASIEQADRINLQGYQNYMGDYLKALGAKGTQEGLRKEAEKNYFSNAIKEANTINALQQAYFPGQYAQGTLGDVLETNPVAKYGGKVKKKVKIKPKLKNSYF